MTPELFRVFKNIYVASQKTANCREKSSSFRCNMARYSNLGLKSQSTIFDPWYNKGLGGEREDYFEYCDASDEYTQIAEKRLKVHRISLGKKLIGNLENIASGLRNKKLKLSFKNGRFSSDFEGSQVGQMSIPLV